MINRRDFCGITFGVGAALALPPELLRAFRASSGKLIERAIPSTGETLPVIGLQFPNSASLDPAALEAVLGTLLEHGGRFLDTGHQSVPGAEDLTAKVVTELGIQKKLFLGLRALPPGPPAYIDGPPGPVVAKAQIESLFARFQVPKLDLVQLPVQADPTQLPVLQQAKKEGRVRYIGATAIAKPMYPQLESVLRNEPIDFVGVDYSIDNRGAEETILPLARERKVAVAAYFPFGVGRLFQRAGATPLPEWAAEFDAKTWAQFFLKYLVSHPAVTVVRAGTTKAEHMLDNLGGGIGRLPDEATRERMRALVDALPAAPAPQPPPGPTSAGPAVAPSAATLDRYVGEYTTAAGTTLTFRRDGEKLYVKVGYSVEAPLVARSETRFSDPRGPVIEFQVGASGAATGIVIEQGSRKTPASRIR